MVRYTHVCSYDGFFQPMDIQKTGSFSPIFTTIRTHQLIGMIGSWESWERNMNYSNY